MDLYVEIYLEYHLYVPENKTVCFILSFSYNNFIYNANHETLEKSIMYTKLTKIFNSLKLNIH